MKGYRTIIWNLVNATIPVMEMMESQYSIPEEWMSYWLLAYMLGNIYLRYITTTPIGKSDP